MKTEIAISVVLAVHMAQVEQICVWIYVIQARGINEQIGQLVGTITWLPVQVRRWLRAGR